ncbi:MAG: YwqG family protein [Sandaracinaceae bacterium]
MEQLLADSALVAEHADYVLSIVRPRIDVVPSILTAWPGSSRLGGDPDLPRGTPWPHHAGGPYRFVGQLNLEEVAAEVQLPRCGLLSLFVADDPEQSFFWQDAGYALALHSPSADPRELEVVHAPPELEWVGEVPRRRIELVHGADVPHAVEQRDDWPHEDLPAALWRWWRGRGPSQRETWGHLLGYPAVSSLAYDPTPGPEWLPLLSLSSVDELDFCWHDGNPLHVFIERERLAAGDFSSLRADAG